MGDYGIKITQPGFDITSTEPRNYVLNSAYGQVKISSIVSGTLTIPAPTGGTINAYATATIAHGLSFIPMCLFWSQLRDSSGKYFVLGAVPATGTNDPDSGWCGVTTGVDNHGTPTNTYVDNTNLYLTFQNQDTGASHGINYFAIIFGDSGR